MTKGLVGLSEGVPADVGMDAAQLQHASRQLEMAVEAGKIGAASLTVVRRGTLVLGQGFGRLRPEEGAPAVEPDSVFLLASITKPVTAWALMLLAEEGEVSLDDPVEYYLPEFKGGLRAEIKVRHLLSHTSGMPDMLPQNTELRRAHAPLEDFVKGALKTPLLFRPNTQFHYQSKGTLLAAEIVERISAMALRDFERERIFAPLGMENSSLGLGGRSIEDLVWCGTVAEQGEDEDNRSWGWNTNYWRDLGAPWGGMHSNGRDLAVLMQTALDGGLCKGKRVLSAASVATMTRNQNSYLQAPWGLGWALADSIVWNSCGELVSPSTFGHSGATGTVAWADPARELICIVLTNNRADDGSLLRRVSNAVAAAVVEM
ncbi:MAG: CubicO group peptidase (beta-lactamase class C family) [Candidatus Latescibacterota bacterium]|jgi:CubicO group peptidase (beta-lactamase class C family)